MLDRAFPEVLAGARTGDGRAWARILDDLSGPLLGFARGRGVEDPEDVLGETLLHVARGLHGFEGDEAGFRAWVFTIALLVPLTARIYRGGVLRTAKVSLREALRSGREGR